MNFHVLAICRASLPLRGIYTLERTNSFGVNVALDKCKIFDLWFHLIFFFFLLRELLYKAHFNLVPADILKTHDIHPVPEGK